MGQTQGRDPGEPAEARRLLVAMLRADGRADPEAEAERISAEWSALFTKLVESLARDGRRPLVARADALAVVMRTIGYLPA